MSEMSYGLYIYYINKFFSVFAVIFFFIFLPYIYIYDKTDKYDILVQKIYNNKKSVKIHGVHGTIRQNRHFSTKNILKCRKCRFCRIIFNFCSKIYFFEVA